MIRVSVPIDVHAVMQGSSAAFALATPLQLRDVVTSAIVTALGPRAPQDKRERVIRRTLDGIAAGEYLVDIDGRTYERLDDVVVVSGTATLRFYARRRRRRAA